ncbi:hypothetical protein INR49_023286 [Caranx melampygus]|nr:hypothetical protein INR49_023286 [Caranx melampygus]
MSFLYIYIQIVLFFCREKRKRITLLRHSLLMNTETCWPEGTEKPLPKHPLQKHNQTAGENDEGGGRKTETKTCKIQNTQNHPQRVTVENHKKKRRGEEKK